MPGGVGRGVVAGRAAGDFWIARAVAEPAHLGAELGPPADPGQQYCGARGRNGISCFLFQFLKLFEGQGHTGEVLGAIVIPAAVLLVLFLMPIVGRWRLGIGSTSRLRSYCC